MKKLMLSVLFIALPVIHAEDERAVRLGDSFATVRSKLGKPAGTSRSGLDFWYRRVPGNEFELRVSFEEDITESRLHPTLRVSEIDFIPDKEGPWDVTAGRIAEVRNLCRAQCNVAAYSLSEGAGYAPRSTGIVFCPRHTGDAPTAGSWWAQRELPEKCSRVQLESPKRPIGDGGTNFDWRSLSVSSVSLELMTPSAPEHKSSSEDAIYVDLGFWKPK